MMMEQKCQRKMIKGKMEEVLGEYKQKRKNSEKNIESVGK